MVICYLPYSCSQENWHWAMTWPMAVCDDEFRQAVSAIQRYYLPFKCHTPVKNLGTGNTTLTQSGSSKNITPMLNELETHMQSSALMCLLSVDLSESFTSHFTCHVLTNLGVSMLCKSVKWTYRSCCVLCRSITTSKIKKKKTAKFTECSTSAQQHWHRTSKWHR